MKRSSVFAACLGSLLLASLVVNYMQWKAKPYKTGEVKISSTVSKPTPRDTLYLPQDTFYDVSYLPKAIPYPVHDTVMTPYPDISLRFKSDTVVIEPKLSQVRYADSVVTKHASTSYQAYVSGVNPHLDSISFCTIFRNRNDLTVTPFVTSNLSYGAFLSKSKYNIGAIFINNKPNVFIGYTLKIK